MRKNSDFAYTLKEIFSEIYFILCLFSIHILIFTEVWIKNKKVSKMYHVIYLEAKLSGRYCLE